MYSFVNSEIRIIGERFPTYLTFIRFFASVTSFMDSKVGITNERFPTYFAMKRLFSSVDSSVTR
uniref:Uncharacterized protein n=1 Tax=Octopus bimaculoides TaxID=37653 RepID=A0A0L8I524_OCTBM